MTIFNRPLCATCRKNPSAINYRHNDVIHYRSQCDGCIRKKKKQKPPIPSWASAGYKKKPHCEQCGFKAKYKEQLHVYHIDGVLSNAHWSNLKTICANCQIELSKSGTGWIQGELVPDF